jgi:hypothetical protein
MTVWANYTREKGRAHRYIRGRRDTTTNGAHYQHGDRRFPCAVQAEERVQEPQERMPMALTKIIDSVGELYT